MSWRVYDLQTGEHIDTLSHCELLYKDLRLSLKAEIIDIDYDEIHVIDGIDNQFILKRVYE